MQYQSGNLRLGYEMGPTRRLDSLRLTERASRHEETRLFGDGCGGLCPEWRHWPRARCAATGGRKRVGYLRHDGNPDGRIPAITRAVIDAVRAGLKQEGFTDGTIVNVDVRFGLNDLGLIRNLRTAKAIGVTRGRPR